MRVTFLQPLKRLTSFWGRGAEIARFPPPQYLMGQAITTPSSLCSPIFSFFPLQGAWSQARESLDCMRTGAIFQNFSGQHKAHMEQLYLARTSRAPYLLHAELKNEDHVKDCKLCRNSFATIKIIICLYCQYQMSLSTYSINVKEKVVMAVVQSLEQSLDLSKCSSMDCHNIRNSYWVSIRCLGNINPLCWAAFFTWNRASSFDINIIKLLGF